MHARCQFSFVYSSSFSSSRHTYNKTKRRLLIDMCTYSSVAMCALPEMTLMIVTHYYYYYSYTPLRFIFYFLVPVAPLCLSLLLMCCMLQ